MTRPVAALSPAKQALLEQRLRRRAGGVAAPVIPTLPAGTSPPLSFAQERLWFLDQYAPGSAAYVIPLALRLRGPLDADALARALRTVVARHEPLRTRFPATADGTPALVVDAEVAADLERADAPDAGAARGLADAFVAAPFDLAVGPPVRALLVRLAPGDHVLVVALHHIAGDGWSVDVLVREVLAAYAGVAPPDPPVRYGDYAAWQRGRPDAGADLQYWREQLAGLEPLDLPADRPRPAVQTYAGAAHTFRLDEELTERLGQLGRDHGATPFMTLLAGFAALLGRHARQEDVALGAPVAGRSAPELEGLIGCFLNMLTMRVDLSGDPTFLELLLRVRDTALDAYSHQDLPFEQLVSELNVPRDTSRSPLFQVIFAMQNYGTPRARAGDVPAGLTVEGFGLGRWATRFDLELYAGDDAGGLGCMVIYNTDLFTHGTVTRLADRLEALLRAAAAAPGACLSALDVLAGAERELVTSGWNATRADYPDATTLHALIEAQVARTPEATAVTFEHDSLRYAELNQRANQVAHVLRAHGVGPDTLVGVCAERSLELVVGLLGVLKAGGAYVPLDPEYPPERLAFMAEDASTPVLLTQRALQDDLPPTGARVLALDDPAVWDGAPVTDPAPLGGPDDLAYAIYTSGSTGRPKGVPNTHRGICNRLNWMQERYGLDAADVVLQKTPASFDVSVWEFFWPLLTGARLVLARPGGHKDPDYLRDLIVAHGVTTLHFVPSMLAVFLAAEGVDGCGSIRRVICSGEELPVDVARRCVATLPGELHNLYGPTEAAIDVSAWHASPDALDGLARVPIGAPIANTTLYVLDAGMRPLPVGVPGELYIGGVQLARGYLSRPALTAERFVPDPFGPPGARLYRTGDLARWRDDGTIDFLGRIDTQVKLRGLRIELGEIEAALRTQPGVSDAAVVVREDRPGDKRLVAYLTSTAADPDPAARPDPAPDPDGDEGLDPAVLRAALKRVLPDYMVPSAFVTLDALPLSPNGKLDRRALPAPTGGRDETAPFVAPTTPTEETIAGIWREVLGVDRVGIDDDFFDLGGHSLLATQVVARIRGAFGSGVSVLDAFQSPTVRELAALVDTPADQRGPRALLHRLTPGHAPPPTSSFVCIPYGGGSAVVYQPLADALPDGYALWSVAIPGHDIGVQEERLGFGDLAARCVAEIQEKVHGPVALYGHCVGSALTIEIARRLEAAGRELAAVYIGGSFPFARPRNRVLSALSKVTRMENLRSDQAYINWLTGMGVDLADLGPAEARHLVRAMRDGARDGEEYFTDLFSSGATRLNAPIVSVIGERDTETEYYQERFREWHFLTPTSALVVLDEAGHYFLKHRAQELQAIVTRTHAAVAGDRTGDLPGRDDRASWWLHDLSRSASRVAGGTVQPSIGRYLAVASGQLTSMTGSALTEFAVPIWIYTTTGSVARFALFAVIALVPGMLVAPLAGAIVDRTSRRRVMLAGDAAAGGTQLALGALLWTGNLEIWHIYPLLACLSVALTFQRLAYFSAIPQLVPKRLLGHANGIVQLTQGSGQVLVPLIAVGLLASIGLEGILVLDVVSYVVAVGVLAMTRFPATMAWRRREPVITEMMQGLRLVWGHRGFRSMLGFFAGLNIFMSPLFLMITPLVLSFATLDDVGRVSALSGLGFLLSGVALTVWGGPRHYRMRGVLVCGLLLAVFCLVTGVRADLAVVAAGAAGMAFGLAMMNGIYATIVQVKVPQRFHGRVFAINTVIAWSTLPLGFGVVAPATTGLLEPLMADGGPLAGSAGVLLGTGPGRGIGLMYVLFACAMAVWVAGALRTRVLSRFDDEVPDALPDDVVGVQALQRRGAYIPTTIPTTKETV